MPAPLKFIQYHWANRGNPRSRILGYVGKVVVEFGVMIAVTALIVGLAYLLKSTRAYYFSVSYFGRDITYEAITTGSFGVQAGVMFCNIIADEEPENYP